MIKINMTEIIDIMMVEYMKLWYRSLLNVKRMYKNARMVGMVLIKRLISFWNPNVKFVEYDNDINGININSANIDRRFLKFFVFR